MEHSNLGRFLKILFGCHSRPDRSFYFQNKQFPICARCTGELAGIFSGVLITVFWGYPNLLITLLMMVPLVADGLVQKLSAYESTNIRRLITGILFGIAFVFMLVYLNRACIYIAGWILKLFLKNSQEIDNAMKLFL